MLRKVQGNSRDLREGCDEDGEASLNRQILSNYVKRKAVEDLYNKARKLIHKELQSHL